MHHGKKKIFKALWFVLVLLALFLGVETIGALKGLQYIGQGIVATNVINVSGTGKVLAVPDTGEFSFSVVADAKTVTDAQSNAATKTNAIIDALKTLGVAEADIQTTNYSSYPTYQYNNYPCVQPLTESSASSGTIIPYPPCTTGRQVLTGYEVNESISVKIRKTADAGTVLTKVGTLGATNISSLNFVVDNPDMVNAEARDKAIADAKAKAAVLAKSLGIHLVKIINFQESGNQPIYYGMAYDSKAANPASVTPEIPVGQNTVTSNVTLTYEIE